MFGAADGGTSTVVASWSPVSGAAGEPTRDWRNTSARRSAGMIRCFMEALLLISLDLADPRPALSDHGVEGFDLSRGKEPRVSLLESDEARQGLLEVAGLEGGLAQVVEG